MQRRRCVLALVFAACGASGGRDPGAAPPVDAGSPASADAPPADQARSPGPSPAIDAPAVRVDGGISPTVDGAVAGVSDVAPAPRDAAPSPYRGMRPMVESQMSLGNTRIFDDTFGVAWSPTAGELLFTVEQVNNLWRWRPAVTTNMGFDIVRHGFVNDVDLYGMRGIATGPNGALVVCETKTRRVTRAMNGAYDAPTTLAERWPGGDGTPAGRLNAPFDAVVRRDGTVYFTDPANGQPSELGFSGLFRVDPAGNLSLVARDLNEPFGVALSPDHDALYVSTGDRRNGRGTGIIRFPINADGSLGPRSIAVAGNLSGTPGGLCTDQAGNLYHVYLGVKVFAPDGTRLDTAFNIPGADNCAFGDADLKSLFFTAGSSPAVYNLWRVRMSIPGVP